MMIGRWLQTDGVSAAPFISSFWLIIISRLLNTIGLIAVFIAFFFVLISLLSIPLYSQLLRRNHLELKLFIIKQSKPQPR